MLSRLRNPVFLSLFTRAFAGATQVLCCQSARVDWAGSTHRHDWAGSTHRQRAVAHSGSVLSFSR